MKKPQKIIQIQTAPPLRAGSSSPYLLALDAVGEVFVWYWEAREWIPLAEMDR